MDIIHHYVEKGAGEALILLHGNGEDSGYFAAQLEELSREYRVIALDTRGHGATPRGDAPFTIRQFAEDLRGFMDEKGIGRAHILGFSDGGNIALVFALAHPERVNRLILNGANLNPRGVRRSVQLPVEIGYRAARLFARFSPEAKSHAELLGLMVNDPNIPEAALAEIRAKTLVIAGENDMIKEAHTRAIAAGIPGAELAILPGDHFVAAGNPKAFNARVLRFLREEEDE